MKREPQALRRGKRFHKAVQREWLESIVDGIPHPERYILKTSGKRGRVDILVDEIGDRLISIIEIKASDWDRMTAQNVVRNVRRQIRQVWSYVTSQMELQRRDVCPGIIFERTPKDKARKALIESLFNEEGIQVVWHDEAFAHLRARVLAAR